MSLADNCHKLTKFANQQSQTSSPQYEIVFCMSLKISYAMEFSFFFFPCLRFISCNERKSTFRHVCPMKTQISLCIRAVKSESSLSAWRNIAALSIQNAHSEDSDQTAQKCRLIWIFAGCTSESTANSRYLDFVNLE